MTTATAAIVLVLSTTAALLSVPTASAHLAPLPGPGDSWQNATDLGFTPGHSYGALPPQGGYHYYSVQLARGESATFRLIAAPGSFTEGFPPYFVLASPRTNASGYQPPLAMPPGLQMDTRAGARPGAPGADGLLPTSYRTLSEVRVDAPQDERWYLVVYEPDHGGAYAVFADPVGFSPAYAWNVPTERVEAYRWQGLGAAEAWGAPIAGGLVAAALVVISWRRGREGRGPTTPLAALSAALLAASTTSLLDATLRLHAGTPLTWALAAAGALLTAGAFLLATRPFRWPRWGALALGVAALLTASGFLLAPVSLILGALLPREKSAARDDDH